MTRTRFEAVGKTDPGCVRSNNEDSLTIDKEIGLLVVADGMGGHNSGEVASELATKTILECARKVISGEERLPAKIEADKSKSLSVKQLEYVIRTANRAIFDKGRRTSKDQGMGTTIVVGLIDGKTLTVAHVGDSRFYLFRNRRLQALTQDHSLVMDQIRRGVITPEEAQNSTFQNILTRALGSEEEVLVDVTEHPMLGGDVLLLCTDGLTKMVQESDIAHILEEEDAPLTMCDRLIQKALDAGGADNVTTVVARISQEEPRGVRNFLHRIFHRR